MRDKTYSELHEERKNDPRFNNLNITELFEIKKELAAEIKPLEQPWLWENYIPLETSTLMAGKGGIGKSQFLMWLAAIISNGSTFSTGDQNHEIKQGNVIIFSAEDHPAYTIIPRLMAAGANLANIHIIESAIDKATKSKERFIRLDQDILAIEKVIEGIGNVKAIFFDPITAYLGDIKENRSTEIRSLILRLNKIAVKYKLANILNTHTRKSSGNSENITSASDEIMGSSAWGNTVRMAFSFTRHHDDNDLYICTASKTNHKKPEGLSYRIKQIEITLNKQKIITSKIEWQTGKVNMNADEAVNKKAYEDKLEIVRAKEFIIRTLSFGSKSRDEIIKAAENEDITQITLKRARQALEQEGIKIIMEASQSDRRKFIWYIGK